MNKITFLVDLNYCLKCLDAARLSQPIDNKVPKVRKPNKITFFIYHDNLQSNVRSFVLFILLLKNKLISVLISISCNNFIILKGCF